MKAYYNEFDPKAAAWLRELIRRGLIAPGDVDERSIKEVKADDLRAYTQCHFFAGIGGWSYALRLAAWADDTPVWTGSCPCQPYSSAGKQRGNADERNLWPDFYRLIAECRPNVVFGEQVEGAIRHGWLDGVSADLEREGYAVGHCVLGAHSAGAPHIRQRLYWVADADRCRFSEYEERNCDTPRSEQQTPQRNNALRCCRLGLLAVTEGEQPHGSGSPRRGRSKLADDRGLGYADEQRPQGRLEQRYGTDELSPWSPSVAIACRDGKARRVAPGVPLLAHGIPGRVAQLRGLGNAICPQVAAAFIEAYLEATS